MDFLKSLNASGDLPKFAPVAGSILQTGGMLFSALAARQAGEATRKAREFEAEQLRQSAGQAIAASQRESEEQRRRSRLIASRALAVAAASGGGASDVTVQNVIANLDAEGAYRSMVALYQGEEKARQLRMAASGREYEGDLAVHGAKQKAAAYGIGAAATGFKGMGSFYVKYGRGGAGDSALISDSIDTSTYG